MELFAAGGHLVIASLPRAIAALVGVLIQGAWVLVWSALLAAFLRRYRGAGASLAATITSGLALGASMLLPDVVGGPVSTLTIAEMVLVHFVLALSFVIGTRLAPPGDGWGAR